VLHTTDKTLPTSTTSKPSQKTDKDDKDEDEQEEEKEEEAEVKIIEQVGTFDEVMLWGHGGQVDVSQDAYARGLGEWIGWAERMHGDEEEDEGVEERKA
jgi:ribonuclease H2 subunit C